MRKKTIVCLFDKGFWFLVSILPLIAFVVMLWFNGTNGITLSTVFTSCGFGIVSNNPIVDTIFGIVGPTGTFPLFVTPDLIIYLVYFVSVTIIHILIDAILFIPRLAHKFMDIGGNEK